MSPIPGKSQNIIWEFLGCGYAVGTVVVLFSSPTSATPSSWANSYLEKSLMNLDIQPVPELPWASQRFMYFPAYVYMRKNSLLIGHVLTGYE